VDDDVQAPVAALLDRLERMLREARSMPMSASCVVNREDMLGAVADLRRALPEALSRASEVLGDREGVVAQGRTEAERLLDQARAERKALLTKTEVHRVAQTEAERILEDAKAEADAMRLEVEEYVDAKLANFEVVLSKTLGAVQRGRARLHGESELDALADGRDADEDERPLPGTRRP
jgi:cell division septum initiation protein DivIVA